MEKFVFKPQKAEYWMGKLRSIDFNVKVSLAIEALIELLKNRVGDLGNLIQLFGSSLRSPGSRVLNVFYTNPDTEVCVLNIKENSESYEQFRELARYLFHKKFPTEDFTEFFASESIEGFFQEKSPNRPYSFNKLFTDILQEINILNPVMNQDVLGFNKKMGFCAHIKNLELPMNLNAFLEIMYSKYHLCDENIVVKETAVKERGAYYSKYNPVTVIEEIDRILFTPKIGEIRSSSRRRDIFDFVEVKFSILSSITRTECRDIIKRNKHRVIRRALCMLEDSKKYTKFGVPVNFLKPYRIMLTAQSECVVQFELKSIKGFDKETGFMEQSNLF